MAHTKVTKTGTQNTGTANTFSYSGSFNVFKASEVEVELDNVKLTFTTSTINESASPREYTVDYTAKTIHIGGADLAGTNSVTIQPVTDMGAPTPRATYSPGSSVTSEDLNNNQLQLMRKAMEYDEQKLSSRGGTMTGNLHFGKNIDITFEGASDDDYETTLTVTDPTADRTVTLPNATDTLVGKATTDTLTNKTVALGSNTVSGTLAQFNTAVTDATLVSTTGSETLTNKTLTSPVLNSTISGTSIKDEDDMSSNSATHLATQQSIKAYTDSGSQTLTNKTISADSNTLSGIAASSFVVSNSSGNIDGSASQKAIPSGTVVGHTDSQTLTNKSIDSDNNTITNIVNGDIKSSAAIEFTKLENLDSAKILVGNSSNKATEVAVSGDITIANNGVVTIANDAVGADQLDSNAVVNDSVASGAGITLNKLENVSSGNIIVGNGSNVPTSVAMTGDVAIAAGGATTIQDNSVEFSMIGCEQTAGNLSNSDVHLPTSAAVVNYITDTLTSAGSFEVIADELNFPATHPDPKASNSIAGIAGMVVSIQNAGGLQINSSGVATNARKAGSGSDDITINGFPNSMRAGVNGNPTPYELSDETGLLVTTTAQTDTAYASGAVYEFHRVFVKPADYVQLSDDINDFNSKYRVGTKTANNDSSNDDGDLFFDTGANKMYVYDGAYNSGGEWKEVTSAGDFKFLTVKDHDQSSGGSGPTFNGSNEEFDLFDGSSDASINSAAQLIVVLNGVVQKPNSGTFSGSEEGFYLNDTHGIKFCDPPPSGSTLFVTQIGSAVTLNEPADNSVSEAKIQTGAVSTDKIADDSVTGAKLSNHLDLPDNNTIRFGTGNDLSIFHDGTYNWIDAVNNHPLFLRAGTGDMYLQGSNLYLGNEGATKQYIDCHENGAVELYHNNSKKLETVTGGVYVYGDVVAGVGGTGNFSIGDSQKIMAGASNDLQLYHDGSNSYIVQNGTGELYIRDADNSTAVVIESTHGNTVYQKFSHTGHDNNFIGYEDDHFVVYTKNSGADSHSKRINVDQSGLAFNADTAAANRLSDYERGTWTINTDEGSPDHTFSASYVKIGDSVTVSCYITCPTSSNGNNFRITSLPFTSKGSANYAIGAAYTQVHTTDNVFVQINPGNNDLYVYKRVGNSVTFADLSGAYLLFTCTYFTA